MSRVYDSGLTEKLQLRVTPRMAQLLRGMPGGYNEYIRQLVVADLKRELAELGQLSDPMAIEFTISRSEATNA